MSTAHAQPAPSPSLFWALTEGRAIFEMASHAYFKPAFRWLPKGDGHPVMVLPGFLASERSTRAMRKVLKRLGYKVYDWGLGRNTTFSAAREADMIAAAQRIYDEHGQKVSLVGWSLGGVFAREIAKARPEIVRQVISLGSPITGPRHASRVKPLFEAINGKPTPETQARLKRLHHLPPVPSTSIYTKTDGVVHWQGSVQKETSTSENIEIPASHIGLGYNPLVMYLLADRLAQPKGIWTPFERSGLQKLIFKKPRLAKTASA